MFYEHVVTVVLYNTVLFFRTKVCFVCICRLSVYVYLYQYLLIHSFKTIDLFTIVYQVVVTPISTKIYNIMVASLRQAVTLSLYIIVGIVNCI